MPTDTYEPATSNDDGYVQMSSGTPSINQGGADMYFGAYAGTQQFHSFVRFPMVALVNAEPITAATLELYNGSDNYHDGSWGFTVVGDDADSSTQIASWADLTGRSLTTATTSWSPSTGWAGQASIDVTAIVQEIVDRAGWVSGNDMQIFVKDATAGDAYTTGKTFDSSPTTRPQLVITYGAAAAVQAARPLVVGRQALIRAAVR